MKREDYRGGRETEDRSYIYLSGKPEAAETRPGSTMADRDSRIELAIRNGLSRVDASSIEARQSVYAAALRSLDRQFQSRGEDGSARARMLREKLVATIDMIEDGYITPMLLDDLEALSLDTAEAALATAEQDELPMPDKPAPQGSTGNRPRVALWSLGFVIVAAAIAALIYLNSLGGFGASTNGAIAYEAAPPFPLVHGETFAVSLNKAAGFVTVTNKSSRTANSGLIPSLVLESDLEEEFSGKTIEVTVSARATAGATATQLEAIYYTAGLGNSGPRTFPLGPEYSDVSFTYDVPVRVGEAGVDYLGVAPASPDANASVDVRSIKIRIKPAP